MGQDDLYVNYIEPCFEPEDSQMKHCGITNVRRIRYARPNIKHHPSELLRIMQTMYA